jgi:hypothetical protein
MTTQRGHRQLPTTADPHAHSASPGRPPGRPGPPLTTSHDDDQAQVGPPLAQHGLCQLRGSGSNLGRRRAVVDTAGDHADPGHPSRGAAGPPPRPTTSFPSDTTDAGGRHWTPGRSDARTGHRSLDRPRGTPDARTGHWTPDAGHERGHGDDSTAGIRTTLAATPSDRTLRCPNRVVLSHYQPAARPHRRPSGTPAHCSPQTNVGSSVERTAKRHPLWRGLRIGLGGARW